VIHHPIWFTKTYDLNPTEMVWDELDHRMKEKQSSAQQSGYSFKTSGKAFLVKLVERMSRAWKAQSQI
jgi:hypothetical protein